MTISKDDVILFCMVRCTLYDPQLSIMLRPLFLCMCPSLHHHDSPQAPDSEDVVSSVVDEGILPSIVKLAGRPTNLSTKWHLSDLEVDMLFVHSTHTHAPMRTCTCTHTHTHHTHTHTHTCMYICIIVYVCIFTYVFDPGVCR